MIVHTPTNPLSVRYGTRGNLVTETAPAAVTHDFFPNGSLTVTGTTTYTYDA